MSALRKILVLVFLAFVFHGVISTDYCRMRCRNGKQHIGCSDGKPGKGCVNFKLYPLPTAAMNLILNLHNTKRNRVAMGEENRGLDGTLESASNMNELTWSYEFANLSMYNVMQCKMAHDDCRGTEEFPHAGQNLGYYTTNDVNAQKNMANIIIRLINDWYSEVKNVPNKLLKSYKVINDGIARGHFTQMVWADATKIGCAVGTFGQLGHDYTVLLCCDYSIGNMLGRPTYEAGTPRSKCPMGYSRKYPGLCGFNDITKTVKYVPLNTTPSKIKSDDYLDDDIKTRRDKIFNKNAQKIDDDDEEGNLKDAYEDELEMEKKSKKKQESKPNDGSVAAPNNSVGSLISSSSYIFVNIASVMFMKFGLN